MRPLSATECINPAIQRTKDVLARPFRWSTYLKLTALAFFAEIGTGSCNLSSPGHTRGSVLPPGLIAFLVAFAVLLGIVAVVLWLVLLYVSSRLQLVLVEIIATRHTEVSPFWRKQGDATWRWIGAKLLLLLAILPFAAVAVVPFVVYVIYGVRHRISSGSAHIGVILLIIAAMLLLVLAIVVAYGILRGLAMPAMALEGVPAFEALRRAKTIVKREPGQVALFLLLQMLLTIAMAVGAEILIFFAVLISLVPVGLVGGGAWLALRHAGPGGTAVLIGLGVALGLMFLCWAVCLGFGLLGPVYVFSQAYSLYFLGGRYPLLGDLLDETTPAPEFLADPAYVPPPPVIGPPEPGMST